MKCQHWDITRLIIKMKVTIFLFLFLTLSSSQLLGIDLGTTYTKVAMVQPGAGLSFAILENTKSERKI